MNAADHLYVHVPFCAGKCAYCSFYSEVYAPRRAAAWLSALEREFERAFAERPVPQPETVYFGGGTPSVLEADELARLCAAVRGRVRTGRLREWTVEANPGTLTAAKLRVLRKAGVTRISLGAQSFQDSVLRLLGRRHTAADIGESVRAVREAGFGNFGLDLIACVPGVDGESWEETLDPALRLAPPHLSVYTLSVEESTPLGRQIREGGLREAEESEQARVFRRTGRVLREAGWDRYEVSNFARPGFACLHNLSFWRGEDYLGFGPAAASREKRRRWKNEADLTRYAAALAKGRRPPVEEETVSPDTDVAERLVVSLRLSEGVDLETFVRQWGEPAARMAGRWEDEFTRLAESGFAERVAGPARRATPSVAGGPARHATPSVAGGRWRLTDRGVLVTDHLAVNFLP